MRAPAMTPLEIAAYPSMAPTVRVSCWPCGRTLYVGDSDPEGGADRVFEAAGCRDEPATCPGQAPDRYEPPAPAGGFEGGGVVLAAEHPALPVEASPTVEAAEAAEVVVDTPTQPGA